MLAELKAAASATMNGPDTAAGGQGAPPRPTQSKCHTESPALAVPSATPTASAPSSRVLRGAVDHVDRNEALTQHV